MVVHEQFSIIIPKSYPLEYAGPVMCSGVTLFDPLRRYGATKGTKVAIVGIGGLGIMGIKIAKAMECEVTAVSRSVNKKSLAEESGAKYFLCSSNSEEMKKFKGAFDMVLNTIPSEHDYTIYSALTNSKGKHIVLGLNTCMESTNYNYLSIASSYDPIYFPFF
jgi:D-arabinose 1-dehydrogenase-like Zn-dependent alcohol dehydrogenase